MLVSLTVPFKIFNDSQKRKFVNFSPPPLKGNQVNIESSISWETIKGTITRTPLPCTQIHDEILGFPTVYDMPLSCTRRHDRVPMPNGKLGFWAFQRYMTCLYRLVIYRWKALILTKRGYITRIRVALILA